MKLQDLKQKGAIVAPGLTPKEITWTRKDPVTNEELTDTFTVFVVRQSFGIISEIMRGDQANEGYSKTAALIASCIRLGDDGTEVMEYDEAYQLQPSLAWEFLGVINEVNKAGAGKN
jgi:hypothetical protein